MIDTPHGMDVHVTRRRIWATLLDGLVLGAIIGIVNAVFGLNVDPDASGFDFTQLGSGGSAWAFLIVLLYYVVLEGAFGRTVGKMVTGIRVVGEDGGKPGFVSSLVRTLLRLVDGCFAYLVGFLIVINSRNRRRLGDMAAKTFVVRS